MNIYLIIILVLIAAIIAIGFENENIVIKGTKERFSKYKNYMIFNYRSFSLFIRWSPTQYHIKTSDIVYKLSLWTVYKDKILQKRFFRMKKTVFLLLMVSIFASCSMIPKMSSTPEKEYHQNTTVTHLKDLNNHEIVYIGVSWMNGTSMIKTYNHDSGKFEKHRVYTHHIKDFNLGSTIKVVRITGKWVAQKL